MDIFQFFMLLGGLAFFLYGMTVMSGGLEKVAGGKLERTLRKMTSNPLKSIGLGMGITVAIQSSSAMTVMLVGLVNSGIMALEQTVGVIMGSNIGTTLTAWLLSLSGIDGDNIFIKMLKPTSFSPLIAILGVILMMTGKGKKADIGSVFVGFAVLMYGMSFMSDSVAGLAELPEFQNILVAFTNPILGLLVGAVFTGIIQSSAATVGIVLAFAGTGDITFGMAIPIILGSNIGTCVTALLSSIGVNKNARRVAVIHIVFNVIGSVICLILLYGINAFYPLGFLSGTIDEVGVAIVHTVFNVFTTVVLLPFSKYLVKFANVVIKNKKTEESYEVLDERLMRSPAFAIAESRNVTKKMAELAKGNLTRAIDLFKEYNPKLSDEITEIEEKIDQYEDKLGTYLVKLSSYELSETESNDVSELLHTIGDFERIGDHAVNIQKLATEMHDKQISFSESAMADLDVVVKAVNEIVEITMEAFNKNDSELAMKVEPLEQVIDGLISESKNRHIIRLTNGNCTIELGFILSDLLTNFSRVSDHCSNIAVAIIQIKDSAFDTHGYLNEIKQGLEPTFQKNFEEYKEKYHLIKGE
ncbi:MAG: Na/Pi cotransporter family protein [Clostridia bacterium]|nr:Na/Pi cotransporter family protein [Clostridia bacterium]